MKINTKAKSDGHPSTNHRRALEDGQLSVRGRNTFRCLSYLAPSYFGNTLGLINLTALFVVYYDIGKDSRVGLIYQKEL